MMSEIGNTFHLIFSTPFGEGALLYSENPFLILQVCLPCKSKSDLIRSAKQMNWEIAGNHPNAIFVSESITHYFNGRFNPTTWPGPPWEWMDLDRFTPLQQSALKAVAEIPYGQQRSYKWVAQQIQRPGAARFVGTTMANNPYPIITV